MNPIVHVIPKPGLLVRDPITGVKLPPEGASVEWGTHWERRKREGDIRVRDEAGAQPEPAAPPAAVKRSKKS